MFPKTHLTIAAAATVVVTAAILMSPSAQVEAKRMSYALDLEQGTVSDNGTVETPEPEAPNEVVINGQAPVADAEQQAKVTKPAPVAEPALEWQTYKIKSGDTLSSLFKKAGFNDGIMLSVIHGEGEADIHSTGIFLYRCTNVTFNP